MSIHSIYGLMKDNLIIIPSFVDSKHSLKKFDVGINADILALTPSAMLSLDILEIPYKTTEEFYETEVYRSEYE